MGSYSYKTTGRTNFKGGKKNSGGSNLIGWDNGKVRAERYTFRTGKWPVSKISFHYDTSVYDGKNIAIRCAISTNSTANVKKSGKSGGHAVTKNGTTTITCSLKANTTYYIVFYPGTSSYGLLRADTNFYVNQTTIDRTACTAPTSLVLSRTLQSSGKTVDLSWSGAAAGNNVQIASYEIYYSTARDGTYQRLFETETITNTTHKVTAPAQGQTHFYKILVKSNPAGYDSPLSAAINVGLTGNVIPTAPTIIEVSNTIVPSTGGQVKFRVNPGSTYSGTKSLYYCTSPSGQKIRFDSPLVVDVQQETTYYFYTYDNIDFSTNNANQTISINVKPKITAVGCTTGGPTTYNALGGDGVNGYQLGYANKVTPVISASETGKVKVALEFYSSDNDDTNIWNNSNVQSVPMQTVDITSTTNVALNECLIHKGVAAALGSTNIHWRLSFVINDGLEDSDIVYFPSGLNNNEIEYEGKYYAIAHAPSLIAKFNRFDTSDIPGTKVGEICDKIRFEINKDTSMTDINVTAISEGNGITIKSVTSTYTDDPQLQYINVTLDNSSIKGGADIKFTVNLSDEDGYLIKTVTGITNVKETKVPAIAFPNELSYGATTINPFTSSGAFTISAAWPFGSYDTIPDALPEYNCSTAATNVIKLVYEDESGVHTVEKTPTWSKQNDTITTSLNRQNIYEWNHSLGYDIYTGVKKYRCRLEITNLFDVTYATPWVNCEFDFNEPAVSPTISKIYWSPDGTDWAELDTSSQSTQAIQKGMYLKFECDFGLYTTDAVTLSILVKTDSLIERDLHFYDAAEGPSGRTTPITYTNQQLSRGSGYLNYGENHRNYICQITDDITTIDIRKWQLKITSESDKEASSTIVETKVLRQCMPAIEFTQCKVDKDYNVDYTFKINNLGGGTLKYCLCDEDGNKQALSSLTSVGYGTTTGSITITPAPSWDSRNISIEIESTVTQTLGTTQFTHVETYYSIPILAYHVTPTIAYRTNSLGINVENPNLDAMVDIHQTAGKSIVLVQGRDSSSNPTKFVMNPTTGAIQFYTWDSTIGTEGDYRLLHTLDLSRGAIDPTP